MSETVKHTPLEAEMLEALRQCTSPIAGYAVKDAAQALEVLSGFLDHIRKVDAIARAAIAKAEGRAISQENPNG